ncbi:MAG: endonuclease/exonuclease/phosphatase family protein [Anaerolineae bacterium]|nr:endonuclease/exonuclease/phosphatase family protein [Anaerolineae bacterium]
MTEVIQPQPPIYKRIINSLCLAYLLLMALYGGLRLLVGDGNPKLSLVNSFAYFLFLPLPILIILALLARSRIAFLRLLPLIVVLILWIGPRFIPKPIVAASDDKTIRVFTANTWVSNSLPDLLETQLRNSDADILCIEEVTTTFAENRLSQLTDLYPYQAVQHDTTRPGDNFTLSRYPIVSTEFIDLGLPDFPEPRRVVINVDGKLISVYTVHLAWPVDDDAITAKGLAFYIQVAQGFDDTARNQQIDNLLAYLKNEPYPFIVSGDFNTSDSTVTYNKLAAALHDSFAEGGQGLGGSWPVAKARNLPAWLPPLIRIDYIWHSDGLRTIHAWQGEKTGSDHLPLLAELAMEG